jgi:hypothetical protein
VKKLLITVVDKKIRVDFCPQAGENGQKRVSGAEIKRQD